MTLTEIKNTISMLDVLSYYNIAMPSYSNKIHCPFPDHNENEPSFIYYSNTNSFYCWGCKRGGSIIDFIMHMNTTDASGAIILLSQMFNLDIGDNFNAHQEWMSAFTDFILAEQETAFKYLESRNIDRRVATYFNVGFCPSEIPDIPSDITQYFLDIKLLAPTFPSGHVWSMENRVVVPIKSSVGHYVGFTGRSIDENATHRYMNTAFNKSEILFGWSTAKPHILRKKEVYIVEGIFDVFALYTQEVYNVVSTLGTSLSKEQKVILSLVPKIILLFDGDSAGRKAILDAVIDMPNITAAFLPDTEDVSSINESGKNILDSIDEPTDLETHFITSGKPLEAVKIRLKQLVASNSFVSASELTGLSEKYSVLLDEIYSMYFSLSKTGQKQTKYTNTKRKFFSRRKYYAST